MNWLKLPAPDLKCHTFLWSIPVGSHAARFEYSHHACTEATTISIHIITPWLQRSERNVREYNSIWFQQCPSTTKQNHSSWADKWQGRLRGGPRGFWLPVCYYYRKPIFKKEVDNSRIDCFLHSNIQCELFIEFYAPRRNKETSLRDDAYQNVCLGSKLIMNCAPQ